MELRSASFEIVCQLTSVGAFPAYKGSMLRGAFGQSLRRAVCTTREIDCEKCLLYKTCPFPQLFVGKSVDISPKHSLVIPPYCIEPPLEKETMYDKGSVFTFTLTLFSYATEYLPYFIHAFSLMGQKGLGNTRNGSGGTFSIQDVLCDGISIFDAENTQLLPFSVQKIAPPLWKLSPNDSLSECCHVTLATPLRFKQENHFATTLTFEHIILLCLRRAKTLWALEDYAYSLDNFTACMEEAQKVQTLACRVYWHDWTRYSGRQKSRMQFGGLMGELVYKGMIRPFLPLLHFARVAHLGKQTTFGLGKITYAGVE